MQRNRQKIKGEINLKENKAKCPFYSYDSQSKICCFGAVLKSKSTTLFFDSPQDKENHFNDFCGSYCWRGCPLAQTISKDL
nr:MAG TPA: hypothetical protein [Caudoviricetes sp.]DAI49115.1 MAG TPA: hypothetical protein [Bacteriophage sp.]